MALTTTPALILKGALAAFQEEMQKMPNVWQAHAMPVQSTTAKETYTFPGVVPIPRVFTDARSIQGFRDFKFDITNKTYELTLLIDLEDFEDDQTGGIRMRFTDLAEVFGTYKDQLFAALLENGASDAPPFNDADGITWATFYAAAGTVGDSASMDNDLTSAAATGTTPTGQEVQDALRDAKATMMRFEDDQGRPTFNAVAGSQLRCVVPPEFDIPFANALNATFVLGDDTAGGSRDNVMRGFAQYDVLPYLANSDTFYLDFLGSHRKPFIFQNRVPLQITIDTTPEGMQERNGVLVMCRERFEMTYGDPRRASRHVYT